MQKGWCVAVIAVGMVMIAACKPNVNQTAEKKPVGPNIPGRQAGSKTGEELFKQFCATCHPDGGNVSDPQRNLRRLTLQDHHITRPEDVIRIMRHPIARMITFDQSTLSEQDARAIAEYVLTAF